MSDPEEDGRPVSDGQWAAMEQMGLGGGRAWIVARAKPSSTSITRRMADALHRRGFVSLEPSRATLTDAGKDALTGRQERTGRHPQ